MLSVMYMKDINWLKLFWELFKTIAPSIVAWYLAVRTAAKRSEKDKKEAREQLKIAKDYNAEVQNKAYKLQFCLRELENREQLYEKALSDTNVVSECIRRYFNSNGSSGSIMASAGELINQLHLIMPSIGTTESLVSAVRPSEVVTFEESLNHLNYYGKKIEKSMNYLAHTKIQEGLLGRKQVNENFNDEDMRNFFDQLLNMRGLILKLIYIVLNEMG
ncbi:hypothetical protein predicted by Glimmer/Critica [Limosilactobacillus fermentum]|nr:hypothetical protein predicted by Glimmer/Critica [Limosilactobacillus fermentum]